MVHGFFNHATSKMVTALVDAEREKRQKKDFQSRDDLLTVLRKKVPGKFKRVL